MILPFSIQSIIQLSPCKIIVSKQKGTRLMRINDTTVWYTISNTVACMKNDSLKIEINKINENP